VESEYGETGGLKFAEENFGQGIYRPSFVESAWGKLKTAALSGVRNDRQDHNAARKRKNKKKKKTKVIMKLRQPRSEGKAVPVYAMKTYRRSTHTSTRH
jgi:hypothetical protein